MSQLSFTKKSTPVYFAVIIAAIYMSSLFLVPISTSAYSSTPLAATTPHVLLRPLNSAPGKTVKVTGLKFTPSGTATVNFNGAPVASSVAINSTGGFATSFVVPLGTNPGSYPVMAIDNKGITASNTLTVAAGIKVLLSTSGKAHIVGTIVTITGSGFSPGATLTILFGSSSVATATVNPYGAFGTTFPVPAMPAGTYTVKASDGTVSGSRPFKIVSNIVASPYLNVAPGALITVKGAGFAVNGVVSFSLVSTTTTVKITATATADSTGSFSVQVQIPTTTVKNGYSLTAVDQSSDTAKTRVTVA
jgi:hypothetical protein